MGHKHKYNAKPDLVSIIVEKENALVWLCRESPMTGMIIVNDQQYCKWMPACSDRCQHYDSQRQAQADFGIVYGCNRPKEELK